MSSTMTIVVAVVVVLAVIALALLVAAGLRDRRSQRLKSRFGPEYERAVEETGDRQKAERMLHERVERHKELSIRELDPAARQRYAMEWRATQSRFVDDPRAAVTAADELLTRLMKDLGYPAESFEQTVADVSVDHAGAVDAYRRGHDVLAEARGQAATDDLRQAMVHYRNLFQHLLGEAGGSAEDGAVRADGVEETEDVRATGSRREVT